MTGSMYKLGLSGGEIALPKHPVLTNVADIYHGGVGTVQAGGRFYRAGVTGTVVGKQGFLHRVVDLLLDIAHVLLLVSGIYLLARGLAGGLAAF